MALCATGWKRKMKTVNGIDLLTEIKKLIINYSKFFNRDLSFQFFEEKLNDWKNILVKLELFIDAKVVEVS